MLIGFSICFLSFLVVGSSPSSAATVYVDTDGTGDYTCDGTNDHIEINNALTYIASIGGGTVYLRGPNTYWIDSTLNISANTTLTGDSTAEIKLVQNAGWASGVPLISGETDADNILITGFIIDGNSGSQSGISLGQGYYNLIRFHHSNNVEVSHMRLEWGTGDGMIIRYGNGIKFLYNDVYKLGHDACYMLYSNNGECAYNTVMTRTNSACRITWGSHFTVHDNLFYSALAGDSTGPAIQLDKSDGTSTAVFDDIEIYNNKIYSTNGAGIWMSAEYPDNVIRAKNVHIHHNTFTKVGQYVTNTGYSNAGIVMQNFDNTIIENNVFDDGGHAGIKWYEWTGQIPQQKAQFTTYVRNNIIMNSDGTSTVIGSGVGIWNTEPTYAQFIVQNNDIYNNLNGQTYGSGFTMIDNLDIDPLCVDSINSNLGSRDYHLKSAGGRYLTGEWVLDTVTSQLIDAGYPLSAYSNEPVPNGGIINIGRYGNTVQASKSGLDIIDNPPVANAGGDKTVTTGSAVIFDGSASTDDKGIISYSWDFNASDGITPDATEVTVTKIYTAAGTYTVTLNVTDTSGQTSTDILQVVVSDPIDNPPVANAGADKIVTTGSAVSFDGSASTDDKGIASYSWDFGDSTAVASGISPVHTYATAGTYTVTLTVTDTSGQASTDTLQVVVNDLTSPVSYEAAYDNILSKLSTNTVLSTTTSLDIGKKTDTCRDMILFDLSRYNPTDTIYKANLSLYWYYPAGATRSSNTIVEVYRPLEWDPQYVTWNYRLLGVLWTTKGGNWFDKNGIAQGTTPYASVTFPATTVPDNKYYEFDVTQLVQEYISGTYQNTGFFLKAQTEGNNYIAFYSSDWANAEQRPKLTVTSS